MKKKEIFLIVFLVCTFLVGIYLGISNRIATDNAVKIHCQSIGYDDGYFYAESNGVRVVICEKTETYKVEADE